MAAPLFIQSKHGSPFSLSDLCLSFGMKPLCCPLVAESDFPSKPFIALWLK